MYLIFYYIIIKASMPPLTTMFGALLIGPVLQRFGCKKSLMIMTIPYSLGFLLMGFTYFGRSRIQLYVGRFMAGMASGAVSPASQIYVISYLKLEQQQHH